MHELCWTPFFTQFQALWDYSNVYFHCGSLSVCCFKVQFFCQLLFQQVGNISRSCSSATPCTPHTYTNGIYTCVRRLVVKCILSTISSAYFIRIAHYTMDEQHYCGCTLLFYLSQVVAFCDVDVKKISKGCYIYEESEVHGSVCCLHAKLMYTIL